MLRLDPNRPSQEGVPCAGQGLTACLGLLARACVAVDAGQWEVLDGFGRDYQPAFAQLKATMEATDILPEENIPAIQHLEREQRRLVRMMRQRQQVIQGQLSILDDAKNHLHRVKCVSETIAGISPMLACT